MTLTFETIQPKSLFALISGVVQIQYFNDPAITIQILKEHIFPTEESATIDVITTWCDKITTILQSIFSLRSLPQPSDIQEVLQTYDITDQQIISTWTKVLKDKAPLIHNQIVDQNRFASSVSLQWRVDSISPTEKTAFIKFNKKLADGTLEEVVLELNKAQVDQLATECRTIQGKLEALA